MTLSTSLSLLGLVAILAPMVGSLIVAFLPRPYAKWTSAVAAAIATVASVGLAATYAQAGFPELSVPFVSFGKALVLGFVFDRMSTLLAPAFVGIGLLVVIYSIPYMSQDNREHPDLPRRRFYAYLSTFIGAMAGLVYSSTLVGQLVFFEITGACSWGLISYYMTPTAKKAGMKALIITHIGALGLYLGAAVLFANTGTFAITAISGLDASVKAAVLLMVLFAAWAKSAQVPMYMWLPSAMEAPTPVSAYLHGASMVKVGVCVFARALVSAGEIPEIVGWVAIIDAMVTMLFGFLMYLPQKDMKRLLAFSTIAQLSYVFFGLGLSVFGSQLAFDGAVCHIFNHAFAKTLFFLVAGSFSFTLGTRMLPKLRGVLKKYPVSGIGFAVAALAIAGVPPMNTFFSKFQIIAGGFSVGAGNAAIMVLVLIMVAETVATFAWFLKWMGYCLPGEPSEEVAAGAPLPKAMAFVFVVLVIMVIVSGPLSASWIG